MTFDSTLRSVCFFRLRLQTEQVLVLTHALLLAMVFKRLSTCQHAWRLHVQSPP